MKKIALILTAVLLSVIGYSQDWGVPKKFQPLEFENALVLGDTLGIDTSSFYDVDGKYLIVNELADGRFFIDTTSVVGGLASLDTTYILGQISDTADAVRDSISWSTDNSTWVYTTIPSRQIWAGGNPSGAAKKSELFVNGQMGQLAEALNITGGGSVDADGSNIKLVSGTGAVSDIANLDVGSTITFVSVGSAAMTLDSATFTGSGQTLHLLTNPLTLNGYDVLVLICTADDVFQQISYEDK